jgi:uncharacterized protein
VEGHARVRHSVQARPLRTCIGCRLRVVKSDLLRVVAVGAPLRSEVIPDPRGRMPGRGVYLHPDLGCLDLAERRRAFPRALRLPGPLDTSAVRAYVEDRPRNHAAQQANEKGDGS